MTEATVTKTQSAQKAGEYVRTAIDDRKAAADFLLLQVNPYIIRWADGRQERVTARKLSKLQAEHPNWMTDF